MNVSILSKHAEDPKNGKKSVEVNTFHNFDQKVKNIKDRIVIRNSK